MFEILKKASEKFAEAIGGELTKCEDDDIHGFVSKIEINGDKNMDIFLVLPKKKLDLVSERFFGSNEDYDLRDLCNEIANLIVGTSKNVADEFGVNYDISVPEFLGEYKGNIKFDNMFCFKIDGEKFYILYKEKR
jgi:hypothetical protein